MGLIFDAGELPEIVFYENLEFTKSVMYFNGNIYHNLMATDDEVIVALKPLSISEDLFVARAASLSLIQKTIDIIIEKYCQ